MTEAEWLEGNDLGATYRWVKAVTSERKKRLLTCACCRALQNAVTPGQLEEAIGLAERCADGLSLGDEERKKAWQWAVDADRELDGLDWHLGGGWAEALRIHRLTVMLVSVALRPSGQMAGAADDVYARWAWPTAAELLRDLVGNPFRPVGFDPAWLTTTVLSLAEAAYEERILPSGELDPTRLAVLSDALEEAGCTDDAILSHLRSPGPHVRGLAGHSTSCSA